MYARVLLTVGWVFGVIGVYFAGVGIATAIGLGVNSWAYGLWIFPVGLLVAAIGAVAWDTLSGWWGWVRKG